MEKKIISEFTLEELTEAFRGITKEEILKALPKPKEEDQLLSRKQVMELLNISATTFHARVNNGLIKPLTLGNTSRYSKKEVIASLKVANCSSMSNNKKGLK